MSQIDECPVEVLLDDFDVFLEGDVVLDVVLGETYSDKKGIIELLVNPQVVAYEILPGLATDLNRHTTFKGVFEAST